MNELHVGTGKEFAARLIASRRSQGHRVYSITSKPTDDPDSHTIDWNTLNMATVHKIVSRLPALDVIVFNQNATALSSKNFQQDHYPTLELWKQIKDWEQAHFVSCQMPFGIVHTAKLNPDAKIVFTLSSMIVEHQFDYQYADYMSAKYQNFMLMKNFATYRSECYFGIDPGQVTAGIATVDQFAVKTSQFEEILNRSSDDLNGRVWMLDGGGVSNITKTFGPSLT